jgi:hypothetical protein
MPSYLPVPSSTGSHSASSSYTLASSPTDPNDFADLEDKSPAQQVREFIPHPNLPRISHPARIPKRNAGRPEPYQGRRPEPTKHARSRRALVHLPIFLSPNSLGVGCIAGTSHVGVGYGAGQDRGDSAAHRQPCARISRTCIVAHKQVQKPKQRR